MEPFSPEVLWIVVIGFIVAFVLSFGIGANDVANSFGTSVGSKVLTVKTACILATIFEMAGAILIGYKVSDTMRKSIIDISIYQHYEKQLMLGYLSALGGSGVWLIVATFFKLPISGTHSIVGSTVGFSLVSHGIEGLQLKMLAGIVFSWFISPIISGVVSVFVAFLIERFIKSSEDPVKNGLLSLPFFYGITVGINVFSVVQGGSKVLYLDNTPLYIAVIVSLLAAVATGIIVYLFVVPKLHVKIILNSPGKLERDRPSVNTDKNGYKIITQNEENLQLQRKSEDDVKVSEKQGFTTNNAIAVPLINDVNCDIVEKEDAKTDPALENIFSFLQILTAIFGSFAHGGNDVSNAIGPLVAIWLIYSEGSVQQNTETPLLILVYGGIGISIGLCLWGRRVIQTIGEDLTRITPSTGFSIEIGAAMTVLLASKIGLPISTTHCKVGSVVFVGWITSSRRGVDWKLFRNITYAWITTVPISAVLSAFLMLGFNTFLL